MHSHELRNVIKYPCHIEVKTCELTRSFILKEYSINDIYIIYIHNRIYVSWFLLNETVCISWQRTNHCRKWKVWTKIWTLIIVYASLFVGCKTWGRFFAYKHLEQLMAIKSPCARACVFSWSLVDHFKFAHTRTNTQTTHNTRLCLAVSSITRRYV